jgi:hypothetical protein
MRLSIIFVLFLLFLLIACTEKEHNKVTGNIVKIVDSSKDYLSDLKKNESAQFELKYDLAKSIANPIKKANLKKLDVKEFYSYEDYKLMVDKLNFVINVYNDKIDKEMKLFGKASDNYHKFNNNLNRYAPLVDNYNELVGACYSLDKTDSSSVDLVLKKSVSFTVELMLITSGGVHKLVFSGVGSFSRTFGLTTFARTCPTCVSTVMSSMYWVAKGYIVNKAGDLSEKIIQ